MCGYVLIESHAPSHSFQEMIQLTAAHPEYHWIYLNISRFVTGERGTGKGEIFDLGVPSTGSGTVLRQAQEPSFDGLRNLNQQLLLEVLISEMSWFLFLSEFICVVGL